MNNLCNIICNITDQITYLIKESLSPVTLTTLAVSYTLSRIACTLPKEESNWNEQLCSFIPFNLLCKKLLILKCLKIRYFIKKLFLYSYVLLILYRG